MGIDGNTGGSDCLFQEGSLGRRAFAKIRTDRRCYPACSSGQRAAVESIIADRKINLSEKPGQSHIDPIAVRYLVLLYG